eukprot:scaffold101797_cov39-Tisochrysis_lutea.AAC.1
MDKKGGTWAVRYKMYSTPRRNAQMHGIHLIHVELRNTRGNRAARVGAQMCSILASHARNMLTD